MTTINIPLTVTVTPTEVTIAVSGQSTSVSVPVPPPVVVPPSPPPPVASSGLVYSQGKFLWGGDWSFAASANYSDAANPAPDGTPSLEVSFQQWGGWQPYFNSACQSDKTKCYPTTPFSSLSFDFKPTIAGQVFGIGFMSQNDTPDGTVLGANGNNGLIQYCAQGANPPIGVWSHYQIPLSAFGLIDTTILKFWISDQSGKASNRVNFANVEFS